MGRFLIVVPLFLALAWLTATSVQIARSETALSDASREMNAWAAARIRPSNETWSSVHDELKRSESLAADNPTTHELLGHLTVRRADSAEYMQQAPVYFAKALELRPVSSYAWASLAEAKYLQGDTKGLFETALVRAAQLGPAEPGVQRMVALYGLAVWDEVAEPTRKAIDNLVAAGVRRNAAEMMQIAERRGRLAVACRHLEGSPRQPDPKWVRICQSTEATS